MEFKSLKNIETSFRQIRLFGIVFLCLCALVSVFSVVASFRFAEKQREKIITQKWIANFPMGLEAWAEFRRTGYPELAPAIDNLSGGVISDNFRGLRRLRYPYTERNLNKSNYDKAVALLGGTDNESVDLFWTKKK